MTESPQDRRRFPRYDVTYPVRILDRSGRVSFETKTANLSRGGALFYVPADRAPKANSTIEIGLSAPGADGKMDQFCCQAVVIRLQESQMPGQVGVAVAFTCPLPLKLKS